MPKGTMKVYDKIKDGKGKVGIIGLGYVGLPIALEFAKVVDVVGFDINEERIAMMQNKIDPSKEVPASDFDNKRITFTHKTEDLADVNFFIVAVPTPIDEHKLPNLRPVLSASKTVGKVLKKGDYVVFESTVYPGCTEEDCIPVLEKVSGLKFEEDFKVGYSPERINPGDKVNTLRTIVKIVSGSDEEALEEVSKMYELVVDAGVHRAPSIKVAEAAKVIENTQRDVNISLINELSIIFNKVGINTNEVLEAAGSKWNFLKFTPGLVGGHCIGIDPYYLTHKAKQVGYHAKVITSGRYINDSMGFYVGKQTVKKLIAQGKNVLGAPVLVLGATFKENVADIRNSKVIDVIHELESFGCEVDIYDPHADTTEFMQEYGHTLIPEYKGKKYDAVVVAVNHQEFMHFTQEDFDSMLNTKGVLTDVKGIYAKKVKGYSYWSL
ncbi:MAG: UDP-N-acetyl-D-galactosamine dehydrogenase [Sphingobacteriales bacterium]|jgi:UDP-N-acetyl-D-galactosamine dehydrogenase